MGRDNAITSVESLALNYRMIAVRGYQSCGGMG